jgi:hypothetical protein
MKTNSIIMLAKSLKNFILTLTDYHKTNKLMYIYLQRKLG